MFDQSDIFGRDDGPRAARSAVAKGWRRRCPRCGTGPMLKSYLKVRDFCPICGEALHHHRADDGPAYLTILLVGHLLAPVIHVVFAALRPDPWIMATGFCLLALTLSLALLPRIKGAIVGFQWARRMHGFGGS